MIFGSVSAFGHVRRAAVLLRQTAAERTRLFAVATVLIAVQNLTIPPAEARSLEDTEKAALSQTVSEFDAGMRNQNYERVIATVPPRVIAAIAKKAGIGVEELAPAMVQVMKSALAAVKVESFSMAMMSAQYKELSNGTPYVLIPTETVIDAGDKGRISEKTHSLALQDDGKWYILRVNDVGNLMILRDVYPDFAGVELPSGSMEMLKK